MASSRASIARLLSRSLRSPPTPAVPSPWQVAVWPVTSGGPVPSLSPPAALAAAAATAPRPYSRMAGARHAAVGSLPLVSPAGLSCGPAALTGSASSPWTTADTPVAAAAATGARGIRSRATTSLRSQFVPAKHAVLNRPAVEEGAPGDDDAAPAARRRRAAFPANEDPTTTTVKRTGIALSPRKLNLVARLVRGMTAAGADKALVGVEKKGRRFVASTLREAVATAVEERGAALGRLVIGECYVTKGLVTKRIRPWHGKGRFGLEHKRHSQLVLSVRQVDDEEWELAYMPGYVHRRFRPLEKGADANGGAAGGEVGDSDGVAAAVAAAAAAVAPSSTLRPGTVLPWEVRSQLDVTLYETYRRTAALRERLAAKQQQGAGGSAAAGAA